MTSRNPLDRSLAFTALLDLSPEFGQTESREASETISCFLGDFYASGETNMYAYARSWLGEREAPQAQDGRPQQPAQKFDPQGPDRNGAWDGTQVVSDAEMGM